MMAVAGQRVAGGGDMRRAGRCTMAMAGQRVRGRTQIGDLDGHILKAYFVTKSSQLTAV